MKSGNIRSYIFYGSLALAVLVLLMVSTTIRQQKAELRQEYNAYQQALKQSPDDKPVADLFGRLAEKYPKSYILHWNYGIALGRAGKLDEALSYYDKAYAANPFLREDPSFLFQYGLWLYQKGDLKKAKAYFTEAVKDSRMKDDQRKAAQSMLEDIKGKGL